MTYNKNSPAWILQERITKPKKNGAHNWICAMSDAYVSEWPKINLVSRLSHHGSEIWPLFTLYQNVGCSCDCNKDLWANLDRVLNTESMQNLTFSFTQLATSCTKGMKHRRLSLLSTSFQYLHAKLSSRYLLTRSKGLQTSSTCTTSQPLPPCDEWQPGRRENKCAWCCQALQQIYIYNAQKNCYRTNRFNARDLREEHWNFQDHHIMMSIIDGSDGMRGNKKTSLRQSKLFSFAAAKRTAHY